MSLHWNREMLRAALLRRGLTEKEAVELRRLYTRARFAGEHIRDTKDACWVPRDYQLASLESFAPRKVHCDGRDVGKTSEIEIIAAWAMTTQPGSEMLIATQCENHLFPLMRRIVRRFETAEVFVHDLVEVKRTPSWFVRFANGFVLWGRIAGPHGMNFQGLHVDWQIVDEAQEMTEPAWGELYQALNGGGKRWVYGVPNGLRNTFYRMTQMSGAEHYNWPSHWNPEFDAAKDAELALLYGGKRSPGYLHRVLGRHGAPAHAVFDLDDYLACVDEGVDFLDIGLCEGDTFAPPLAPDGAYYMGCDLGYARDPSEFVIYRAEPPHLVNVLRVRLEGVNYARQQEIVTALDKAYRFRLVGIDAGNNGRAVAHNLMAQDDSWCAKVVAVDFGGSVELDPLPDGRPDRRPAKTFMTDLLTRLMRDRCIVFPRLPDRESQYASHTYSIGPSGHVRYEKGDDHIIDADRCAAYVHHLETTQYAREPILGVQVDSFR